MQRYFLAVTPAIVSLLFLGSHFARFLWLKLTRFKNIFPMLCWNARVLWVSLIFLFFCDWRGWGLLIFYRIWYLRKSTSHGSHLYVSRHFWPFLYRTRGFVRLTTWASSWQHRIVNCLWLGIPSLVILILVFSFNLRRFFMVSLFIRGFLLHILNPPHLAAQPAKQCPPGRTNLFIFHRIALQKPLFVVQNVFIVLHVKLMS